MLAVLAVATVLSGAEPVQLTPELQPLSFLVGSCWRGEFPRDGGVDTHCFTPMFGGRFIRDEHVVTGARRAYAGESIYRWDATAGVIRFVYFSLPGGYSQGEAHPEPGRIVFPDEHVAADGTRRAIQTVWTPDGPDAYHVLSRIEDGQGGWNEMLNMRMTRSGPAE